MTKLSIIIPCYNCVETLKEAFDSCFTQNLTLEDFEIIMVDDGSSDTTWALINKLAGTKQNVKVLFHKKNKGGGAARNTGIRESSGTFIFCLDSDNILEKNTFSRMISFAENFNLDGVAIHDRRFFSSDTTRYKSSMNLVFDRNITLEDLFNETHVLLDNFLYRRTAYNKTKGYPEHHGFDTQCFEVRFLSAGNKVQICPETIFYHRQAAATASYYEREYNSGNFSKNYYLIFEEIAPLLSDEAVLMLMKFDIFTKWSTKENLLTEIFKLARANNLFKEPSIKRTSIDAVRFEQAIALLLANNFIEAIASLAELSHSETIKTQPLWYAEVRAKAGMTGTDPEIVLRVAYPLKNGGSRFKKLYRHPLISPIFKLPLFSSIIDKYITWKSSL